MFAFHFDQSKNTKEASRVISELYPEDVMTVRTCEWWFAINSTKATSAREVLERPPADVLKSLIFNL